MNGSHTSLLSVSMFLALPFAVVQIQPLVLDRSRSCAAHNLHALTRLHALARLLKKRLAACLTAPAWRHASQRRDELLSDGYAKHWTHYCCLPQLVGWALVQRNSTIRCSSMPPNGL